MTQSLYRPEPTLNQEHRNPVRPAAAAANPIFQGWGQKV